MNRQQYTLIFLMAACLLLSLTYCPPFDLMMDDKEIFKYTGMAILRGDIPYRDFFDHKPPMIFFINAAGFFFGTWGLWAINTILALVATLLFFNLCRRYRLSFPWLLPLLFNLMIRDNLISLGINMTREYTAFFTLIFFSILLGRSRYRYFLLGIFAALIFFTQQDQALPLIPFLLYAVFEERLLIYKRILSIGAGFLALTAPLLLYFAAHHALGDFREDAFRFNMGLYTSQKKSLWEHFRTVKTVLDRGNYELPFMIALVTGVASLFMRNSRKALVAASLAALFLTLSPEFMGGRWSSHGVPGDFIYYFLPVSAATCMVLFTVVAFGEDPVLSDRKAQLPYALLLCASLGYTALQRATHLGRRDADPVMNTPELTWLRQQHPRDYQLFVFYNDQYTYFYTDLKILAPSKWIYQHFYSIFPQWDADRQIIHSIGQDLLRHRTRFVLMDARTIREFYNPEIREWWLSFMEKYYKPIPIAGRTIPILWQLKDLTYDSHE